MSKEEVNAEHIKKIKQDNDEWERQRIDKNERLIKLAAISHKLPSPAYSWFTGYRCPKCRGKLMITQPYSYRGYMCKCGYEYAEYVFSNSGGGLL